MEIIIPDEILQASHLSVEEVKQELAVLLFQKDKITIGQLCIISI